MKTTDKKYKLILFGVQVSSTTYSREEATDLRTRLANIWDADSIKIVEVD